MGFKSKWHRLVQIMTAKRHFDRYMHKGKWDCHREVRPAQLGNLICMDE